MDHMELEKEKGITITSAATTVFWDGIDGKGITHSAGVDKDCRVNIIDTPGHVDFTVEVERSLRVLDGAILVLCSVAGVQSQSITVDRQMKRYRVPRLAFLNKMDRMGANPYKGRDALIDKLGHNAVLMQIPVGEEENFKGVVDLVDGKAYYFDGDNGENVRIEDCPEDLKEKMEEMRAEMLDKIAEFDDEAMEKYLDGGELTQEEIHRCVKKRGSISPVLFPSIWVPPLKTKVSSPCSMLLLVISPLPWSVKSPRQKKDVDGKEKGFTLNPDPEAPLVMMAFKITEEQFGQLTYTRIYQGRLNKGHTVFNTRTKKKNSGGTDREDELQRSGKY